MHCRKTVKNNYRSNLRKSNFTRAAHLYFSFLYRCFCTTSTWNFQKLLSYTFYEGNVHFFLLPLIFTLHWWPLAFLILSPPLQNFHLVLLTNRCLPRWASLACSPLSLFLSFSRSIFQICGHDNLSKLNNLDNTDTETIFAFRFRLYWLFCCPCFTRRRWLCDFPPK